MTSLHKPCFNGYILVCSVASYHLAYVDTKASAPECHTKEVLFKYKGEQESQKPGAQS